MLKRSHLRRYLSEADASRAQNSLSNMAEWIQVTSSIKACRDSNDDKFLELAVDGKATHLITGDLDLLALNPFREIRILTPQAFLASEAPAEK